MLAAIVLLAAGCGGSRASGSVQSTGPAGRPAIVGAWHESYNRAEYVRAGADPGEAADRGNWGAFVLTFRTDGRYTLSRPDQPLVAPSGTYRVKGGTVTLTCTCDTRAWYFHWSVYRDKLSLHRAAANLGGPPGLVVKPWLHGR
jgi:hypothetical protein